jgi:CHAT domain-containing protein
MADIELMVLPARVPEDPPRFLLAAGGLWRDLGSATKLENLSTLRTLIDEELRSDMETLDSAGGAQIARGHYFSHIYEPIVPESVQRVFKTSEPAHVGDPPPLLRIHIDPTLDWIPWEVAHDGETYLGLRFRIARLPIVPPGREQQPAQDPWPVQHIYNFLGEFVLDDALLPGWQQTFPLGAAANVTEKRFPDQPTNRFPRVGDVEQAAADASIVHFTCHGGIRDAGTEGGSFWTLNHKQPASPQFKIHAPIVRALKNQLKQPLIFGNACGSSGQAAGAGGLVNSFGALFIQAGASGFVGTVAPIAKTRALEFAARFYQNLLVNGDSISTALWRSKDALSKATPGDPSPLFYCQYGSPGSRYALG